MQSASAISSKGLSVFVVTMSQCDMSRFDDDPGPCNIVHSRVFATRAEAETFVRNTILPLVKDCDNPSIAAALADNQTVATSDLEDALMDVFPNLTEDDESRIQFDIREQHVTTDTSPFKFRLKFEQRKKIRR